jgi:hypothetical protein
MTGEVTAARTQFDHWVRQHLTPENATLAERVADLLGPIALPALDTLVRGAYDDGYGTGYWDRST